jgi:flagellar protein FliS
MNRYLEEKILTAEPVELVRLLYQTAIASVREARAHLRAGRIAERARSNASAYAAIAELNGSLNLLAAPELAGRLRGLYNYMEGRLVAANLEQSDAPLEEVLCLLNTLAEGWTAAAETLRHDDQDTFAGIQPTPGQGAGLAVGI